MGSYGCAATGVSGQGCVLQHRAVVPAVWCSVEPGLRVEAIRDMQSLKETSPSVTHKQLSETLRHMGLSVEDEVRCPKSGYAINMIVHDSGRGTWAVV